ncbi:MAG TPA: serine hydrolase [Thermomicrobiaceae bacterium]|nr:serine hydrolase [Thermomicrobiaceae bacterium]
MQPESRRPGGRWGQLSLALLLLGATLLAVVTRGPVALPSDTLTASASDLGTPAPGTVRPPAVVDGEATTDARGTAPAHGSTLVTTTTPPATPAVTPPATPAASPTPVPLASLPAAAGALVSAAPAEVGAVIALPDGTVLYDHDPDRVFNAASLYKLGIMAEVFHQREEGKLIFEDPITLSAGFFDEGDDVYTMANNLGTNVTVDEALRYMVEYSSNVAAKALLYVVGTGNVNATLAGLGLKSTELRWSPTAESVPSLVLAADRPGSAVPVGVLPDGAPAAPPEADASDDALNVTTASDMARFYELLLQGKVVSAQASAEMLDMLSQQQINDRIPAGLPAGTKVAHKTGNLVGVVHDVGIIYAPKGPIVVVLLSDNVGDEGLVDDMMRQIGRLAYDALS